MTTSVRTGRFSRQRRFDYRRLVAVFDSYVQTGRVEAGGSWPRRRRSTARGQRLRCAGCRLGGRDGPPRSGTGHPVRLMEGWRVATLVFLEGRGIAVLDGAVGASVPGLLGSLTGSVGQVVAVLGGVELSSIPQVRTGRTDLVNALNLAGIKRFHAIVPVLEDADEERVVRACASGVVSARDAAITLLAWYPTGLRACDIVVLRMGDVDWRGHTIGLVQQKTGNPLTLPLPALAAEQAGRLCARRTAQPPPMITYSCVR